MGQQQSCVGCPTSVASCDLCIDPREKGLRVMPAEENLGAFLDELTYDDLQYYIKSKTEGTSSPLINNEKNWNGVSVESANETSQSQTTIIPPSSVHDPSSPALSTTYASSAYPPSPELQKTAKHAASPDLDPLPLPPPKPSESAQSIATVPVAAYNDSNTSSMAESKPVPAPSARCLEAKRVLDATREMHRDDGSWHAVRVRPKEHTYVYKKHVPGHDLPLFKSLVRIGGLNVKAVAERLTACKWYEWIPSCSDCERLQGEDSVSLLHTRFAFRMLAPRESLVWMYERHEVVEEDGVLTTYVHYTSDDTEKMAMDSFDNRNPHYRHTPAIRCHMHTMSFRLRPTHLHDGTAGVEISCITQVDLCGSIPHWMLSQWGWLASLRFVALLKDSFVDKKAPHGHPHHHGRHVHSREASHASHSPGGILSRRMSSKEEKVPVEQHPHTAAHGKKGSHGFLDFLGHHQHKHGT
ncbi:unnamed protein product [Vitrella brassicaformis CCMP3155]|uniref:START domain-containing protein n=1 Tax=Vitrella brassicaformis (strain CCMP3155) TaxID=1169540 RepID=A0A0G4FKZ9_VITBC|nr:unnamed protein product [Vitrella brassicaformis CCMP3155]|eukprot:CEM14648.1 unnamed protein product [Vitrella brassicaformis CCMP3155]